jgi:undecaprenyl-diphosphatase
MLFLGAIAVGLAHLFDFQIESIPKLENPRKPDLINMFRGWGFLGTWVLIAITARLLAKPDRLGSVVGWKRHPYRKEWLLLASPLLSGAAAEAGKLMLRRLRPHGESFYIYKNWLTDPFSSAGLGIPSSHTAVAFGGSTILLLLFPKLRTPAIVMAAGCMTTRVLSGSHYFSDGIAGALIGIICGILSIKLYEYLNRASQRTMVTSLNSNPSIDLHTRPEWKPVTEKGQVTYDVQVIEKSQVSNGVEV